MSRLVRWSIKLGVIGSSLLSLGIGGNLVAVALPQEEVLEKLDPVPVFTIADEQGAPLVEWGEDEVKVARVFISQGDANEFFNQVKTKEPELAEKARVRPVSLGEVYKLSKTAKSPENSLNFVYVPEDEAVNSAKTIGEANQQPYQDGVPLFVARGGEGKRYLTIERNSQQVIPFFFDKAQLEEIVAKFKQQKPEMADSVYIEVVRLEEIIETIETSEDQITEKIVLVPSAESIAFLSNHNPGQSTSKTQTLEEFNNELSRQRRAVMDAGSQLNETMSIQQFLIP